MLVTITVISIIIVINFNFAKTQKEMEIAITRASSVTHILGFTIYLVYSYILVDRILNLVSDAGGFSKVILATEDC